MTVGQLKKYLENVPDDYVVMTGLYLADGITIVPNVDDTKGKVKIS